MTFKEYYSLFHYFIFPNPDKKNQRYVCVEANNKCLNMQHISVQLKGFVMKLIVLKISALSNLAFSSPKQTLT